MSSVAEDDCSSEAPARLPSGGPLSPRKLQQLGVLLGFHDGHELIHYLFEDAWVPGRRELSHSFLRGFETVLPFDGAPLYSALHEACYAQGFATRWSAARVLEYMRCTAKFTRSSPVRTNDTDIDETN